MTFKLNMTAIALLFSAGAALAQPDEHRSSCASSPEQLYQKPETLALLHKAKTTPTLDLNSMTGVWQVQGIPLRSDKIGVNVKSDRFVVQIKDIVRNASICVDEERAGWLRIVIHNPRCPENKNIYVRALGPNSIQIEAYQTRLVGSARFRRVSANPALTVKPYVRPPCATNWRG